MFIASVYILAVIPNLLVASGMPHESTVAAVILTTAFTTILIGLVANVPVIVAPGLGLSAFFAYTICGSMGLTWQTALGAVFISGAVFIVLTITKDPNSQLSGFHSFCINVPEDELVKAILKIAQYGHSGGKNLPELP